MNLRFFKKDETESKDGVSSELTWKLFAYNLSRIKDSLAHSYSFSGSVKPDPSWCDAYIHQGRSRNKTDIL